MTTDHIQKFILNNEHNFHIAASVNEAWPEVRRQIAVGFLAGLEIRLKKELKEWHFSQDAPLFEDKRGGFSFWKAPWADEYAIGLQAGEYGSRVFFGVSRMHDIDRIRKRPFSNELLGAIVKNYPSAKPHGGWWEAKVFMQSPASDWRKPDVFWQMKADSKFLDDVAEQLLQIAKISEPIIDRLVQNYKTEAPSASGHQPN